MYRLVNSNAVSVPALPPALPPAPPPAHPATILLLTLYWKETLFPVSRVKSFITVGVIGMSHRNGARQHEFKIAEYVLQF